MTVAHPSDNILPAISKDQANALTENIRYAAHDVKSSWDKFLAALNESRLQGAHIALGISDWDEYASDALKDVFEDLSSNARRELINSLHADMGMSIRAIAKVLDMRKSTVHNRLSKNLDTESESTEDQDSSEDSSYLDSVASAIARGEKPPPSSRPRPTPMKKRNSYPETAPVPRPVSSDQAKYESVLRAAPHAISSLAADAAYVERRGDVLASVLLDLKDRIAPALRELDKQE